MEWDPIGSRWYNVSPQTGRVQHFLGSCMDPTINFKLNIMKNKLGSETFAMSGLFDLKSSITFFAGETLVFADCLPSGMT